MINQTLEEIIKYIQKSISFDSFSIYFDNILLKTDNQKYFDLINDNININFEEHYKSFFLEKPEFIFKINDENNIKDCKLSIYLKKTKPNQIIEIKIDFYIINKVTEKSSVFSYQNYDDKNKLYITSMINNNTFIQKTNIKTLNKVLIDSDTFTPINKIDRLIENLIFV